MYSLFALLTSSYICGLVLYFAADLIILPLYMQGVHNLTRLKQGLDTIFVKLEIVNCFYVTLDSRVESIDDIKDWLKESFSKSGEDMQRWRCVLVKVLGQYYRRELEGDNFKLEWHKAFETCNIPMSTEAELARYIKDVGRPKFN